MSIVGAEIKSLIISIQLLITAYCNGVISSSDKCSLYLFFDLRFTSIFECDNKSCII